MKLIRGSALLVLLLLLAVGPIATLDNIGAQSAAVANSPLKPCQQPAGFATPVEINFSTASTAPRLLGDRDFMSIIGGNGNLWPQAGISIAWTISGWQLGEPGLYDEVLFTGTWGIPRTGALTFGGGYGAVITAHTGDLVLLVCGADGEIDYVENDGMSTPLAAGSSTPIQSGESFFVFLGSTSATYWLFGNRSGETPESVVTVELVGSNGSPRVCGIDGCWPAPILPSGPLESNCDENTCSAFPEQGGCGGIRCWTK